MRISFGSCNCQNRIIKTKLSNLMCNILNNKIKILKAKKFSELVNMKSETFVSIFINSKKSLKIGIYKEFVSSNELKVVVQVFCECILYPNYISSNGIGLMFVDGFSVDINNNFNKLKDNDFNIFR